MTVQSGSNNVVPLDQDYVMVTMEDIPAAVEIVETATVTAASNSIPAASTSEKQSDIAVETSSLPTDIAAIVTSEPVNNTSANENVALDQGASNSDNTTNDSSIQAEGGAKAKKPKKKKGTFMEI